MSPEAQEGIGNPILLSFTELRGIHTQLATLSTKLDNFQTVPAKIERLDDRITVLEQDKAVQLAKSGLYGKGLNLFWGLALVIIGAAGSVFLQEWLRHPIITHTTN